MKKEKESEEEKGMRTFGHRIYISWKCLGEEFDNNLDLSYHNHNDISC